MLTCDEYLEFLKFLYVMVALESPDGHAVQRHEKPAEVPQKPAESGKPAEDGLGEEV